MTPQNGASKDTLYEQVLDFARREIEDASSQMDALRQSLRLVESRVEAAKSVYEAVAARLNLEDELEGEAQLDTLITNMPPAPLPSVERPQASPPPVSPDPSPLGSVPPPAPFMEPAAPPVSPEPEPAAESPMFAEPVAPEPAPHEASVPPPAMEPAADASPVSPEPAAEPPIFAQPAAPAPLPDPPPAVQEETPLVPPAPAASTPPASPEAGSNGAVDGFSMDLIRKHLEERDRAAQNAAQAPPRRSEPESAPEPAPAFASVPEPAAEEAPAPPPPASEPAPAPAQESSDADSSGGFPGLSEADRALIGEYLRSKRDS